MYPSTFVDRSPAEGPASRAPAFGLLLAAAAVGLLGAISDASWSDQQRLAQGLSPLLRAVAALLAVGSLMGLVHSHRSLQAAVAMRTAAEARAKADALTDELTGLYNRRGFRTLAEHQLKIARRTGMDVVVLYVDLNAFKAINDAFGHAEGDRALCEVARLLYASVRETDLVARMGGDEFALLILDADPTTTERVSARITRALARRNASGARPYAISVGIGAARLEDAPAAELDEMLAHADAALYQQKRGPRLQIA